MSKGLRCYLDEKMKKVEEKAGIVPPLSMLE
jgi:hypothetical protein